MPRAMDQPPFDDEELATCIRVLEAVADDLAVMAQFSQEQRKALQTAAGIVMRPDKMARKRLVKALRKKKVLDKRAHNESLREKTGLRVERERKVYQTPPLALGTGQGTGERPRYTDERRCYVCKEKYDEVHAFYDQMCPACGDFNQQKRSPRADLAGRVALVTGGRVKIGYQAVIMLLRNGAHVVVTTRFVHDAAKRFAAEADFDTFKDRLSIYGCDLRHTPSVEALAESLERDLPRLDYIIHNACQTVRRPPGFYAHLLDDERRPLDALPAAERALVEAHHAHLKQQALPAPAELSQLASPADRLLGDGGEGPRELFPDGLLDKDLQQVDLREHNSWRLTLAEVPTVELLEVFLVNAVAPFVLSKRLKPLMTRHRARDLHIVNVSAMEGQFYKEHKTDKHPHTNMAKAALNMLTRTSAPDYRMDGIHMNAVDTGWVTDEDPAHLAEEKAAMHRFSPPLDIVDGAARIVDPIFHGANTGEHLWGLFLKDYKPTAW